MVCINAICVLAEFGIVSIRPSKIEEALQQGNKEASIVKKIKEGQDDFISAAQLGITASSIALGWVGENTLELVFPVTQYPELVYIIIIGISFLFITYFQIVLGELIPKNIAIQFHDRIMYPLTKPLALFARIVKPVIILFNGTAWLVLSLFGIKPTKQLQHHYSEEELKLLITESTNAGVLNAQECDNLKRTFDLPDTAIKEFLTPRSDMITMALDQNFRSILNTVLTSNHSRFPVYNKETDSIIGILYAKDLLGYFQECLEIEDPKNEIEKINIKDLVREVDYVPETMRAHKLLLQFQTSKRQIAIVTNEFGGIEGLVTIEDVLELLVGDIQDEYEKNIEEVIPQPNNSYNVNAQMFLDDFNDYFNTNYSSDESITIGGYLIEKIGEIPNEGEEFNIPPLKIIVSKKGQHRLEILNVLRLDKENILPVDNIEPTDNEILN